MPSSLMRPSSAPSPGSHQGGGQSREARFLLVNNSASLNATNFNHLPTASSLNTYRNDISSFLYEKHTTEILLEHDNATLRTLEIGSGAPSSRGSHDNDPWRRRTLLTLGEQTIKEFISEARVTKRCIDGGSIRGYSRLLLLQAVMEETARLEVEKEEPRAGHSSHLLEARNREPAKVLSTRTRTARAGGSHNTAVTGRTVFGPSPSWRYFPAHYFDYVAGTSTGGYMFKFPTLQTITDAM